MQRRRWLRLSALWSLAVLVGALLVLGGCSQKTMKKPKEDIDQMGKEMQQRAKKMPNKGATKQ